MVDVFDGITSLIPMELVCIDNIKLELYKGRCENILVVMDHFTRYAYAIPKSNQAAITRTHVLPNNFFLHYGFQAKLQNNQGADFESRVIKKFALRD